RRGRRPRLGLRTCSRRRARVRAEPGPRRRRPSRRGRPRRREGPRIAARATREKRGAGYLASSGAAEPGGSREGDLHGTGWSDEEKVAPAGIELPRRRQPEVLGASSRGGCRLLLGRATNRERVGGTKRSRHASKGYTCLKRAACVAIRKGEARAEAM